MLIANFKDLGAIARHAREKLGESQQELADRADLPREWITRLETGALPNPTFGRIQKLFVALGLELRVGPPAPKAEIELSYEDSDLALDEPAFVRGPGR